MIGTDIASMQAREVEKDIVKCASNSVAYRRGIRKEISELATNVMKQTKICAFFLV